jgi:predicted nucleic acid-binding protein
MRGGDPARWTALLIDGFDAQIAAICRAQRMPLATRNLADFRKTESK